MTQETPPACTCQEPGSRDDVCEIFVPRMHPELKRMVMVRAMYYRKSCPLHGKTGRDGFGYHEVADGA